MRWYAETGPLRLRQQLLDAAVAVWAYAFVRLALHVRDLVLELRTPGVRLEEAATGLADRFGDAAGTVEDAPLVGDRLSTPFEQLQEASRQVAAAGVTGQEAVERLALVLALLIALLPVGYALLRWLPGRLRYAREAGAAVALRGDVDLLALRAATTQPLHRLARLGPAPVTAWRAGTPGAGEALAALQLASLGLRAGGQPPADGRDGQGASTGRSPA